MRFEYCIACYMTLAGFASAGPILQRSQNPDLSPLTNAARPAIPAKASVAGRQKRALIFDVSDVVEQRIAAYNEACVVIHGQSISTTICSTAKTPPSASPAISNVDPPAPTENPSEGRSTRTETVVVTRQPLQAAPARPQNTNSPPPNTNPPPPNTSSSPPTETPKPSAIMSLAAVSSKIVPVLPGAQAPSTPREMKSTLKTATETMGDSKAHNSPPNTSPLFSIPFSFPWPLPLSWIPKPGVGSDMNSIILPGLSTFLPQATQVSARPTDTTTTIHITKTFVTTMTAPPPESAAAPAPGTASFETNPKNPQQTPQQPVKEDRMTTTTVYVTACNPANSPVPIRENEPSARPAPSAPPAPPASPTPSSQAAPTEASPGEPTPPPTDNPAPPKPTPPSESPSGRGPGGGRGGGHGGGGDGGRGDGKGREDGEGDGDDDDDDDGKRGGGAHFRPITLGKSQRKDGGGLVGVLTRAAEVILPPQPTSQ
ncbi:hypothetical protein AJ78_04719 [Emergomyces pasteurianus Ep9510]|uniref:Uncharacterized protein n=1 Tax=Emergomyces pasteurianus Ep9510 TaxID=1447872 RepID=A0A1J9QIH4_9EURO|nr:hypothetical protein AJ78_04719 [Emergomyces pasteurianus Ep9510]